MAKFYVYDNASRRLKNGPYSYDFDVVEQFAGSWRGVLRLDDEAQIANLSTFGPQLGIKEISEDEYNSWLKKKLSYSKPTPDIIRLPTPAHALAAAAAIKSPSVQTISSTPESRAKPSVEDAVTVGTAQYVDPLETRSSPKRGRPTKK